MMVGREEEREGGRVGGDVGFAGGGGGLLVGLSDYYGFRPLVCFGLTPCLSPPPSLEIPLSLETCKT